MTSSASRHDRLSDPSGPSAGDGPPVHTGAAPTTTVNTLTAEHAVLLCQVRARCLAVTAHADIGHWPSPELHQLLDYLHVEVLQQVVDEEWRLFRTWHHAPQDVTRLRGEHVALRQRIEALTDAAASAPRRSPAELAGLTAELLTTMAEHFGTEQALLADTVSTPTPAMASLGSRPHEWYPLTEGPVIELDALPGRSGADAVLGRLLRLGRGERIDLSASSDPRPLWRRLAATHPEGYGFCYLERGPTRWRVEITRRDPAD